jgi:hypothetical protein
LRSRPLRLQATRGSRSTASTRPTRRGRTGSSSSTPTSARATGASSSSTTRVLRGQAKNPDFGREDSFEDSDGEVWASESDAIAAFNRMKAYPFDRCFKAAMKQEFVQGSGIKFSVVSSGPISIGKLAPRQLTYGLKFRITVGARKIGGRIDIYAFSRGRADGSVMVASLGAPARPIPLSLERKLATLVAQRLKH